MQTNTEHQQDHAKLRQLRGKFSISNKTWGKGTG